MREFLKRRAFPVLALAGLLASCSSDSGPSGPPPVTGAVALSAGLDGSCAIGSSGGLACWGSVPTGSPEDTAAWGADALGATSISTPVDLISVTLSRSGTPNSGCFVGSDNQTYCWGYLLASDQGNTLGVGFAAMSGLGSMASVSFGEFAICGTRTDHGVRCVGWYTGGGRGTDSIVDADAFDLTPNALKPTLQAFGTALGVEFGCAIRTDSLVACWGQRFNGQLGGAVGDTLQNCGNESPAYCQPGPALVAGGAKYRQVAADGDHACATRIDGGVDCWGRKVGTTLTSVWGSACAPVANCLYAPTAITLPAPATRVVVGWDHVCALLNSGEIYCWGDNTFGQLGRAGASSQTPVQVSGGFLFVHLAAGQTHTCAIEAGSGSIGCWGSNDAGQLGDGTTTNRDHPVAVVAGQ